MSTDRYGKVAEFLLTVKMAIQQHNQKDPRLTLSIVRDINVDTLASLEFNVNDDLRETILSLTPLDYIRGPMRDRQIKGDLWEFGKKVKGRDVYMKLKLTGDSRHQMVKVLSFHFPSRHLNYYFRGKREKEMREYESKLPGLRQHQTVGTKEWGKRDTGSK